MHLSHCKIDFILKLMNIFLLMIKCVPVFLALTSRNVLAILAAALFFSLNAYSEEAGKVLQTFGTATVAGVLAKEGVAVQAGDKLTTGKDGYLYLKMIDGGFLILRPSSTARVVAYHVDVAVPEKTRIKIELDRGVARSVSGAAVKNAKENFRFNTPVAAIGVRGTDFTVFTDQQTTRISVAVGGVVVSGFGDGCTAEGRGPCEGASTRELFANQSHQVLQVLRGQSVPQLMQGGALQPDAAAPVRGDEPAKSVRQTGAGESGPAELNLGPMKIAALAPVAISAPVIVWGRWQPLVDVPADLDMAREMQAKNLVALNSYFALFIAKDAKWFAPLQAEMSFKLENYRAQIQADGGAVTPATLENARLDVNFAKGSFSTQFDLLSAGKRTALQAQGGVYKDGAFANVSQFLPGNNMLVQGALANEAGVRAGYLFQSRIDNSSVASGVTYWAK